MKKKTLENKPFFRVHSFNYYARVLLGIVQNSLETTSVYNGWGPAEAAILLRSIKEIRTSISKYHTGSGNDNTGGDLWNQGSLSSKRKAVVVWQI